METESFLNEGPGCKLFLTLRVSLSSHSSYADKKKMRKEPKQGTLQLTTREPKMTSNSEFKELKK